MNPVATADGGSAHADFLLEVLRRVEAAWQAGQPPAVGGDVGLLPAPPSVFAVAAGANGIALLTRKGTLVALSHAMEEESAARRAEHTCSGPSSGPSSTSQRGRPGRSWPRDRGRRTGSPTS
jgi:hypothetical protein